MPEYIDNKTQQWFIKSAMELTERYVKRLKTSYGWTDSFGWQYVIVSLAHITAFAVGRHVKHTLAESNKTDS